LALPRVFACQATASIIRGDLCSPAEQLPKLRGETTRNQPGSFAAARALQRHPTLRTRPPPPGGRSGPDRRAGAAKPPPAYVSG